MNDLGENAIRFSPEISVFSYLGGKTTPFFSQILENRLFGGKRDYFSPRFKQNQFFWGKIETNKKKRGHLTAEVNP